MTVYRGSTLPVPVTVNSAYESCVNNGDDPTGRFKTIVDRIDAYDAATASDGLGYVYSILRDVTDRLSPPVRTLWSVVFDVHAMRLYISTVQNSQLRYADLSRPFVSNRCGSVGHQRRRCRKRSLGIRTIHNGL